MSSTPATLLPAFIAAQGTYCNDAAGLFCDGFAIYDVGYISSMCSPGCATFMTVDIGGVNRRWWT